jgi:hypothetical protein
MMQRLRVKLEKQLRELVRLEKLIRVIPRNLSLFLLWKE